MVDKIAGSLVGTNQEHIRGFELDNGIRNIGYDEFLACGTNFVAVASNHM